MDYEQLTEEYIQLAAQMLDEAFDEQRPAWMERMEAEMPRIRQVLAWLRERHDAERGLRLAYLLQEMWFEERYTLEGLELLQEFLSMPQASRPDAARAQCLDLAGALALNLEQLELAAALKAEGIAIFRRLDDAAQLGYALLHMGHLEKFGRGRLGEAYHYYQEALGIFSGVDDPHGAAHAVANLAGVSLEQGHTETAREQIVEGLRRYSQLDLAWDLALSLGTAAGVLAGQGRYEPAARLAAASAAQRTRIGVSLPESFLAYFRRIEAMVLDGLDPALREPAWAEGQALTLEQAVAYALESLAGEA